MTDRTLYTIGTSIRFATPAAVSAASTSSTRAQRSARHPKGGSPADAANGTDFGCLLCYEADWRICHRRRIAEFLTRRHGLAVHHLDRRRGHRPRSLTP